VEEEILRLRRTLAVAGPEIKAILKEKNSSLIQGSINLAALLKRPEIEYRDLEKIPVKHPPLEEEIKEEVEIQIKYEGYIKKQASQVKKFEKIEHMRIPLDIDYSKIKGLAVEAMQKLEEIKPLSIGQASRISGVNPADISVLLIYMEQKRRL